MAGCEHTTDAVDVISRVFEGLCPSCDVALDRRDDHGLCPCCGFGYSATGDEFRLHVRVDVSSLQAALASFSQKPGPKPPPMPAWDRPVA